MARSARFAVVTPYYKESRETLARCIESVRRQTEKTDHILVADGFAQDWIDGEGVRRVNLDMPHGDYGDAARGLGGALAVAEGYAGFGFLDADNWIDDDHVAACVSLGTKAKADLVIAERRFVRVDGTVMPTPKELDPLHVDTNCNWFCPGAFHLVSYWTLMPRELAPIADRVFQRLTYARKIKTARLAELTINYTCLYEDYYVMAGETPPPEAKPVIRLEPTFEWILARGLRERRNLFRRTGLDLEWDAVHYMYGQDPIRYDVNCPCLSGKKFSQCHAGAMP